MAYGAQWTNTNPVAIGDATKKDHYDNAFDNGQALMSSVAVEHNNPSGGSQPGVHSIFRQATFNQGDSPAPDTYGMETVKFSVDIRTEGNGMSIATIDNSIDYRDRWIKIDSISRGYVYGTGSYGYDDTWKPGGVDNDKIYAYQREQTNVGSDAITNNLTFAPVGTVTDASEPQMTRTMGYTSSGHSSLVYPSASSPSFAVRAGIYGNGGGFTYQHFIVDNDAGSLIVQQRTLGSSDEDLSATGVINGFITIFSKENKI